MGAVHRPRALAGQKCHAGTACGVHVFATLNRMIPSFIKGFKLVTDIADVCYVGTADQRQSVIVLETPTG